MSGSWLPRQDVQANGGEPVPTPDAIDFRDSATVAWTVSYDEATGAARVSATVAGFAAAIGGANEVLKVNAAGTALEYGKLTTANLDAAAAIVGTQLAAGANILGSQLSATAGIAATQLAAGASGTVLIGGASNSFSAAPTVTSLAASSHLAAGGTVATAGALRLAHGASVQGRDVGNAADRVVASWGVVANDTVNLGDANVVTRVTGSALHAYAGATQVAQLGVATSDFIKMGDVPASTGYLRVDDSWSLNQRNGNPGTADRNVVVCGGESVTFGSAAQTGATIVQAGAAKLTCAAGGGTVLFESTSSTEFKQGGSFGVVIDTGALNLYRAALRFVAAAVAPTISQADQATTAQTLKVQAANVTTGIGSDLVLTSGTGSTSDGAVKIQVGTETMVEACEVAAGRRIVALCRGSALTTTQMPANSGDRVVFGATAATIPTAAPVDGGIVYWDSNGDMFGVNEAGVHNQLN